MIQRLGPAWDRLDDLGRQRLTLALLAAAAFLVLSTFQSGWLIEDAVITYTYARNAAAGEGFVAYAGGERVEGFSNPSWTLWLTFWQALGVTPFLMAKLSGALFGAAALLGVSVWAERLRPGAGRWAPLILAADPQHLIWSTSGLENPLFTALLVASVVGLQAPGWRFLPGALALGGLAATRPEAPLYAAVIAGWGVLLAGSRGGLRAQATFLVTRGAVALAPWLLWEAWSYLYFAFPFPMTYYAKIHDGEVVNPFAWSGRGWTTLARWSFARGLVFLAPWLALSLLGPTRAGRTLALAVGVPGTLLWALGYPKWRQWLDFWPVEPEALGWLRIGWVAGAVVLLPLVALALDFRRDPAAASQRGQAVHLLAAVGFFTVYSDGDWMEGFRWQALSAAPLAVLLADLGQDVLDRQRPRWAALALGTPILAGLAFFTWFLTVLETSPWDIHRRVGYMKQVRDRLHLERPTVTDVDFGGTMWWWQDAELVDLAGLNDVPVAQHTWQPAFMGEYLFRERRSDFLHAHGFWADRSRVRTLPEWTDYVEIPGYPAGRRVFHVGNLIRKDLFLRPRWEGVAGRGARFANGVVLAGWEVGAPVATPGGTLRLDLGWRADRSTLPSFRAWVALVHESGAMTVVELPPAYDWLAPAKWGKDNVAVGRHTLHLPEDLPLGSYDLLFAVVSRDGKVITGPNASPSPRWVQGEVAFPDAVQLGAPVEVERHQAQRLAEIADATERGDCAGAEAAREQLRKSGGAEPAEARIGLARCWAWTAESAEFDSAWRAIRAARRWDHRQPEVRRVAALLAARWSAEGDEAAARHDLAAAHERWRATLDAEPHQSWVRRRLEEARDRRLGLNATKTETGAEEVPDPG